MYADLFAFSFPVFYDIPYDLERDAQQKVDGTVFRDASCGWCDTVFSYKQHSGIDLLIVAIQHSFLLYGFLLTLFYKILTANLDNYFFMNG